MNIPCSKFRTSPRCDRGGFATIVIIVIITLLLIYLMGNVRTLHYLGRDLHMIDQLQQRRIQKLPPIVVTNTPARVGITHSPGR
ncbi:MAG: hypothetical protein NTX27_14625 [Verrucomicrobia bacterium]|jgi:hypothetical protein|nr:hypothetical protein [Verrucomicrobiota bacterium]